MRKNIFIKSMLRQPLRTGLLVLLVAIASFAFVLRTVEYIVVREQIHELSQLYRSVGFVRSQNFWSDVSRASTIISDSPQVGLIDRRIGLEGVLHELFSADVTGMLPGLSRNNHMRVTEAIFYATVEEIYISTDVNQPAWILVQVHEVFAGHPNIITATENVVFNGFLHERVAGHPHVPSIVEDARLRNLQWVRSAPASLAGLEIGSSYLLRARYYVTFFPYVLNAIFPGEREVNPLVLLPLNDDGLMFAPSGFDLGGPELSHIPEEIEFINHNARTVQLISTMDMYSLPMLQPWAAARLGYLDSLHPTIFRLREGRFLNIEDHENGNRVAVISQSLARMRNIHVGDMLTLSIPQHQQVVGVSPIYGEVIVRSTPEENPAHVFELEIVGIYQDFARGLMPGAPIIYIPTSILPDIEILPPEPGIIPGWDSADYLPAIWYSFTLADPRHDQAFFLEYGEILADLGLDLVIFESDAHEFWATIDPMIMIITFNAAVFFAVLILVLLLVSFLYLQLRRKEMAIQLALGFTKIKVFMRTLVAVLFFCVPAILAGGAVGWTFALRAAEYAVAPLADIVPGTLDHVGGVVAAEYSIELSYLWFVLLAIGIIALVLAMILTGAARTIRTSILLQLQGVYSKPVKRSRKTPEVPNVVLPKVNNLTLPKFEPIYAKSEMHMGKQRWVLRHMVRSPVKTVLGVLIALFFILVLGWLQESILRTEHDIYNLYETTVVWGEILQENPFDSRQGHELGDVIFRHTVDNILHSGYVENVYIESGHSRAFIVPATENGTFPDNWDEIIGFDRTQAFMRSFHTLNNLFSTNDLGRLIYLNSFDDDNRLTVEFADGFDRGSFYYAGGRVPIIVSEFILEQRGISLGDEVFIGYTVLSPTLWDNIPAVVIGVHNGHIAREPARDAVFMYVEYLENMMRGLKMYTSINFTVDTSYNRNIADVRYALNEKVTRRSGSLFPLTMFMTDQSLHNMIGIATQTLLLLELVYPIAVGAAVVIAGVLAMVLMLYNAKKAATMHVLGMSKKTTMALLFLEQFYVCIAGVVPGVVLLALMGVTFNAPLLISFGLYMAGVFVCAAAGAIMITRREPLELLQVKE